jgi:hypothetical protein
MRVPLPPHQHPICSAKGTVVSSGKYWNTTLTFSAWQILNILQTLALKAFANAPIFIVPFTLVLYLVHLLRFSPGILYVCGFVTQAE